MPGKMNDKLKPCIDCGKDPCECNKAGGIVFGDGFNTGIIGGIDMDMSTPF